MDHGLFQSIQLYIQLKGHIIDLWIWFVAGNFAALAAYFSAEKMVNHVKLYFLIGFGFYAAGNLVLLIDNLLILGQLQLDIDDYIKHAKYKNDDTIIYKAAIQQVVKFRHPVWVTVMFHLVIDSCVTFIVLGHKNKLKILSKGRS